MSIVIKRYQNRKLYNTQLKKYVTLEELEDLIKSDQDIMVIDNRTGKDITAITLSQIIFEFEKNRSGFLPIKLLLSLVQSGGNRIDELKENIINSLSLFHNYDMEIERRINILVNNGELSREKGAELLEKLIASDQSEHLRHSEIEEFIKSYLKGQDVPTQNQINLLIQKIDAISQQIDELYVDENKE
jgi:polyhydroxyalkanoate synthesis repressor PhaR